MARKNLIKLDFDTPATVIGIASNEKIWKLCWGINQELNIELASAEEQVAEVSGNIIYSDFDTNLDFDYFLLENNFPGRKVSRLAKQFRYWLVIRHIREETPNVTELITGLNQVNSISWAQTYQEKKTLKSYYLEHNQFQPDQNRLHHRPRMQFR